ncbi:MAG: hypothetical protein F4Z31_01785 [Gemmatimonadetes bacterium]|nr:hypothetical protein [Gemmatimonadota bacterium]
MITTLDWEDQSACGPGDIDLFWPDLEADPRDPADVEESVKKATVHLCGTCPVSGECLVWGIESESVGVFGGATTAERHALGALREDARRRLADLRDADALEAAAAVYAEHGPDQRDLAGLSVVAIQTIWGVRRATARAWRIDGPAVSTNGAVLESLADGQPRCRDEVIDEVAKIVAHHRPEVRKGGRNAARAAVLRLEADGRIIPIESDECRMVMLATAAA